MSQFSYSEWASTVAKAQSATASVKVGFFKLANDGDEALVRINCGSVDALDFASVHTINTNGKWMRVSCLNHIGSYSNDCELCAANAAGDNSISKANKKVYIQMLVKYKDHLTGAWADPIPVIWERPAGYSREIANKLSSYGDLRKHLFKITRNGKPGDMKTTYTLDYAPEAIFKQELIPEDFSAFANFNIAKHSYWEKTAEEIHTFLVTGEFPETVKQATKAQIEETVNIQPAVQPTQTVQQPQTVATVLDGFGDTVSPFATQPQPTQQSIPATQSQQQAEQQKPSEPVRNFNNGTSRFTF